MRSDQAPPVPPEPALPRWARAADGLTLLLGAAAFQAAAFGGFQIPGLSVTNPWRPLVMAVVVAGLRHYLVRRPPAHARLWRWTQRIRLGDAAPATGTEGPPTADLKFFRTLDFLVLLLVWISFSAVVLLVLHRFDARAAVITGLILTTAVGWFTPARFDADRASAGKPVGPVLLLVLAAALLFRTEPFLTLDGARDPGVYAGMSAHLQREGTVFVRDRLPEALPDERSRDIYRAGAPADSEPDRAARPVPGPSPTRGGQVFALPPLHPLWMAIFAEAFGDAARFHAVGFFGLLGVLGLSLLAFELTGSRPAAFAAGLLAATNPLHVFFSRSPAPETVALAFSSLGFYYLARAFRGRRRAAPAATASLVALAAACVSLVFFVRGGGFPYIPALAPLFGLGVWLRSRSRDAWGRPILGFCAAVAGLYGVTVLYGLRYPTGGPAGRLRTDARDPAGGRLAARRRRHPGPRGDGGWPRSPGTRNAPPCGGSSRGPPARARGSGWPRCSWPPRSPAASCRRTWSGSPSSMPATPSTRRSASSGPVPASTCSPVRRRGCCTRPHGSPASRSGACTAPAAAGPWPSSTSLSPSARPPPCWASPSSTSTTPMPDTCSAKSCRTPW